MVNLKNKHPCVLSVPRSRCFPFWVFISAIDLSLTYGPKKSLPCSRKNGESSSLISSTPSKANPFPMARRRIHANIYVRHMCPIAWANWATIMYKITKPKNIQKIQQHFEVWSKSKKTQKHTNAFGYN